MFTERYKKERKRYQDQNDCESLHIGDFIAIFARMWPYWRSPSDRVNASRKVGITANGIDKSLINREKFAAGQMTEPPPVGDTKTDEFLIDSPEGVRKGSLAYYKYKAERAAAIIALQKNREVGPAESGMLVPQVKQPKKNMSRFRISEGHGSQKLSKMLEKRRAHTAARDEEERAKAARAEARVERATERATEFAARLAKWRACENECVCERAPCVWVGFLFCPSCSELKKGKCRKAAWKTAREAAFDARFEALSGDDDDQLASYRNLLSYKPYLNRIFLALHHPKYARLL